MNRLLLDSNILIDYLAVRQPFYAAARKLMILGVLGEVELWISSSQVNDIFYVISQGGSKELGISSQQSLRECREFIHICGVLEGDIDAAIDLGWDDLEDACVYQSALKTGASFIITRDKKGFEQSSIPVLDASAYFDHLARDKGLTYEEITHAADTASFAINR